MKELHKQLDAAGLLNTATLWDDAPGEILDRRNGSRHKLLASCGLGTNSVAGLILLAAWGDRPDCITFADTGAEKSGTYKYLPILNDWLVSVGFPSVTVVRRTLRHDKQKREQKYNTLEEECIVKTGFRGVDASTESEDEENRREAATRQRREATSGTTRPKEQETMMTSPGVPKRCPNCGSSMNAGESCPECRHTERQGVVCDCRDCEEYRETAETQIEPTDGFDEVRR